MIISYLIDISTSMKNIFKCFIKKLNSSTISVPDPETGIKTKYLTRYYLFGKDRKWGNIYIHNFHSSDLDEELHNHPFEWSFSFILSGGYIEQVRIGNSTTRKDRKPFTFNFITKNNFHRVFLKKDECWSIFFAGPRTKSWGFWDPKTNEFRDWTTSPNAIA